MESGEPDPITWLRQQAQAELALANLGVSTRAEGSRHVIADCEAKLEIIDLCAGRLDESGDLDEDYHDGRDDWERERDEAVGDLAEEVLVLLARGYQYREGYREEDWRS